MRKPLMGLLGLMVATALAPGVALAAEGPPMALDEPAPMIEVVAEGIAEPIEIIEGAGFGEAAEGVAPADSAESAEDASAIEVASGEEVVPAAAENSEQIVSVGGTASGTGAGNVEVTVGKTIEPTDIENYFDITLVVEVTEPVHDDSTAVVIVMDVSNTMNDDEAGRAPGDAGFTTSRLANAQTAASEFIRQYCEGEGLSPNRMLGVVTFNTNAQWAEGLGMQVVSAESIEALQSGIGAITAPSSPSGVRFTNMEAGLLLAKNALDQLDAAHKYVVFLTDGFPTTYVDRSIEGNVSSDESIQGFDPYEPGAYDPAKAGTDGYFADEVLGLPCPYGTSSSDKAAARAAEAAAAMKSGGDAAGTAEAKSASSGINVFSVGIAIGSQTVQEYVDHATGTFSIVDRASDSYVIGAADDPAAYETWLAEDIAGGPSFGEGITPYANGDNLEELQAAFEGILADIKATSGLPLEDAYVTDPMGANVEFQYFYDVAGKPATGLVGQAGASTAEEPLENSASFEVRDNAISWNLADSGYQVLTDEAGARSYRYELEYRVRLANEAAAFEFGSDVPTNGTTSLDYKTAGEWNDPVEYPIPVVKGFDGTLSFVKVDKVTGHPIAGVSFELSHSENCPVCKAAEAASAGLTQRPQVADMTVVSNAEGVVSYTNVPSGHAYVLVETEPAQGYYPLEGSYAVAVSYGDTDVSDAAGSAVFATGDAEGSFRIANEPIPVPPVDPPVVPDDPDVPVTPDVPDVPDKPADPEIPDVPQTCEEPEGPAPSAPVVIPQTGDSSPWRAVLALVLVGAVAVALEALTRRNNRQR